MQSPWFQRHKNWRFLEITKLFVQNYTALPNNCSLSELRGSPQTSYMLQQDGCSWHRTLSTPVPWECRWKIHPSRHVVLKHWQGAHVPPLITWSIKKRSVGHKKNRICRSFSGIRGNHDLPLARCLRRWPFQLLTQYVNIQVLPHSKSLSPALQWPAPKCCIVK